MKLTLALAVILVLLVWHTSRCEKFEDVDDELEGSGRRVYGLGSPGRLNNTYGRTTANLFSMG